MKFASNVWGFVGEATMLECIVELLRYLHKRRIDAKIADEEDRTVLPPQEPRRPETEPEMVAVGYRLSG
ncbi:hypothetical protein TSUD_194250 [Trifolium subterraneum]|uniref:Uncharacterized protein n=1 Tax=Trifolium subterraneum TaxID=3900 RepID=A0A2Z6NH29_TRISU|nr:hypothetical protein TSUD_194250 [Trifolium subterraneum]